MDPLDFKAIEKHFGAFVRALAAKGRMRPDDANWQKCYRETYAAANDFARKLEQWKSGSPRRDATYDPKW
jgi:hypothetical protein